MKVIIIGGVAGGATAAARIRRLNEQAEIVVFERTGFISYANCGLPYHIGGIIEDPQDLTLQTPESFDSRFRIKMKVHHEVTAIHPETKTVSVKTAVTQKYVYHPYRMEPSVNRTLGTRIFCLLSFYCRGSIRSTLVLRDGKSKVMETAKFFTAGRNYFAKQCFSGQ